MMAGTRAPSLLSNQGAAGVVDRIFESWDAGDLLAVLRRRCDDVYLVGGSIRDFVLDSPPTDLDLVVPNGTQCVDAVLATRGRCVVNRHGNRHYRLSTGLKIDVIEPRYFYKPFTSVERVLGFFDVSVNAVGVGIATGEIVDPLDGLHDLGRRVLRLPEARWTSMSAFESVHLLLRLCRLLERHDLRVVNTSLAEAIVPMVFTVDWSDLGRLHGFSRHAAIQRINRNILGRGVLA